VLFQEFQEGNAKHKKRYDKVVQSARLARERNLQYVWVDTCAIDKRSSAELSEAINSMYTTVANFGESRWFTRGWTLQELIAPLKVEFFSKEWQHLGTKDTLSHIIERVTGIEKRVLEDPRAIPLRH
jgi:hypothetical protein